MIRVTVQTPSKPIKCLIHKIISKAKGILTSLRSDYLQERYMTNPNKENILQHLQSFLQCLSQGVDDDEVVNMINLCSLCMNDAMIYFCMDEYIKLLLHFMKHCAISREDKLCTFSNIASRLNKHKVEFCARFIKSWNERSNDIIWDACKILSIMLSGAPRWMGNTMDQYEKFLDWSDNVLNVSIIQPENVVDGKREVDISVYDNYLLGGDDNSMDDENSDEDDGNAHAMSSDSDENAQVDSSDSESDEVDAVDGSE